MGIKNNQNLSTWFMDGPQLCVCVVEGPLNSKIEGILIMKIDTLHHV